MKEIEKAYIRLKSQVYFSSRGRDCYESSQNGRASPLPSEKRSCATRFTLPPKSVVFGILMTVRLCFAESASCGRYFEGVFGSRPITHFSGKRVNQDLRRFFCRISSGLRATAASSANRYAHCFKRGFINSINSSAVRVA